MTKLGFIIIKGILMAFILSPIISYSQTISLPADCQSAKTISAKKKYYSQIAPEGPGDVLEYQNEGKKNKHFFQNEHHSAWYKFQAPITATMELQIIPDSINDDYDFILYEIKDSSFCDRVISKTLLPLRTCISRNDTNQKSRTGLKLSKTDTHIHSGPGSSFVSALDVKKGKYYGLALDNCYENGGAHTIVFRYFMDHTVSGKISTISNEPLNNAKVYIEEVKTGNIMDSSKTSPDGSFSFVTKLRRNQKYEVVAYAKDHFFNYVGINQSKESSTIIPNLSIQPIVKDGTFVLEGLNFEPNVTIFVSGTAIKMERILRVFRDNPTLKVEIQGHANGAGMENSGMDKMIKDLSTARAKKVWKHLIKRGIAKNRLTYEGFGDERMLFPNAKSLRDKKKNMRVEINVLEK